ncbi:UNVERIFIED_CONTAM: hypothetical protein FKN15_060919 [Acipenser sinensis]
MKMRFLGRTCLIALSLLPAVSTQDGSSVVGSDQPLIASPGEDVILPCHITPSLSAVDMEVRWYRQNIRVPVHLYEDRRDRTDVQDSDYRGRTDLFRFELQEGILSLNLRNLRPSDSGVYSCYATDGVWDGQGKTELIVRALGTQPSISMNSTQGEQTRLVCRSEGWSPEPEVNWRDRDGNDVTSLSNTTVLRDKPGSTAPPGLRPEQEPQLFFLGTERPQPKRGESVRPQPKEGGVGASIAQEGEGGACTALGPKLPAEGECLLVPPPPTEGKCLLSPCPPAEGECLLSPCPPAEGKCLLSPCPPAEGKCLLSPSPPAEGECLLGPRPPAEDECLLVSLPPPALTPAREGDKPQSPARKAEPHQSPAREAEQHQSPAKGGDYTLLPPPLTGDYTLLPPSSPGDHTLLPPGDHMLLPPPLLPPQEPEGEELQAPPPENFWGGEGQDAGVPQQPLFLLLKAARRAPARPPQQREPAPPQPPSEWPASAPSPLPPPPPPSFLWEDCLPLPPPPAEGEYVLVPPSPLWEDCWPLPPPPAEDEYLLVPPPPGAEEQELPLLPPPPKGGDYTLLPPSSPGDHMLLPPPLLPPQEPEGEELQAPPPENFWGGEGQDAGVPQQPLFMLLKAARRAPAQPPQRREPAPPGAEELELPLPPVPPPQGGRWPEPQKGELPATKKGEEVWRPLSPAAVSLQEFLWPEPHKGELPAMKKGEVGGPPAPAAFSLQDGTSMLSAVPLPAGVLTAWPAMGPLKPPFPARDYVLDCWIFKGGGGR